MNTTQPILNAEHDSKRIVNVGDMVRWREGSRRDHELEYEYEGDVVAVNGAAFRARTTFAFARNPFGSLVGSDRVGEEIDLSLANVFMIETPRPVYPPCRPGDGKL